MYLTGRTSKFATGGIDNFLPGSTPKTDAERNDAIRYLEGLLAHDGPQYATDAELWNAVADALVAVQRKLTGSASPLPVGSASAVVVDSSRNVYLADSIHKKVVSFTPDGASSTVYQAATTPGAIDVAVNRDTGQVYVVNPNLNCIDIFSAEGLLELRWKPTTTFKPLGIAHHKAVTYNFLYIIDDSTGLRNVDVYDAATYQKKGRISTLGIKVRQGADDLVYLIRNDASIYRLNGFTATKLANVPVRDSYVDISADFIGYVFIVDRNAKIIRIFDSEGTEQTSVSSVGASWEIQTPTGLAIDGDSYLYVTDHTGVIKQVDLGGNLIDQFAADAYYPDSINGSCMVTGALCQPLTNPDSTVYPSKTGPARWKKLIMSSNPEDGSNKFTGSPHIQTSNVNVEFVVNPGEIVWPTDIRISIRGTGAYARAYFKKIPNGTTEGKFVTAQADGSLRLRYIFTVCQLGPTLQQGLGGTYTVDALGYVSPL